MRKKRKVRAVILLVIFITIFFPIRNESFQQVESGELMKKERIEEVPEKIIPGPKNIKERIAVYVFIIWTWLMILVLFYFLRLKIKEVDRINDLKFFSDDKE